MAKRDYSGTQPPYRQFFHSPNQHSLKLSILQGLQYSQILELMKHIYILTLTARGSTLV